MIRILIAEDEDTAAERLIAMLNTIEAEIDIVEVADTVSGAVKFIQSGRPFDLMLSDIQLADGSAFDIFRQVDVTVPVIFITAYDEYALQAFRVNSIDYLLKPVKQTELQAAVKKYEKLTNAPIQNLSEIVRALSSEQSRYNKRIVVKTGQQLKALSVDDMAYFFTEDRVVFVYLFNGHRYPVDYKLDELTSVLDPALFFRVNRQLIVSIKSIDKMFTYTKSRIKITLHPPLATEAIVSSERSAEFKSWLQGKAG